MNNSRNHLLLFIVCMQCSWPIRPMDTVPHEVIRNKILQGKNTEEIIKTLVPFSQVCRKWNKSFSFENIASMAGIGFTNDPAQQRQQLNEAAKNNQPNTLRLLCNKYCFTSPDILNISILNSKGRSLKTPLFWACLHTNIECAQVLFAYKADVNCIASGLNITVEELDTRTPIATAVAAYRQDDLFKGADTHERMIRVLLDHGARGSDGLPKLIDKAFRGLFYVKKRENNYNTILSLLLNHNFDSTILQSHNFLSILIDQIHTTLHQYFIRSPTDQKQITILYNALQLLINAGANPYQQFTLFAYHNDDEEITSPLEQAINIAMHKNNTLTLQILLSSTHFDPKNHITITGDILGSMHFAINLAGQEYEHIRTLLQQGRCLPPTIPNTNQINNQGNTYTVPISPTPWIKQINMVLGVGVCAYLLWYCYKTYYKESNEGLESVDDDINDTVPHGNQHDIAVS